MKGRGLSTPPHRRIVFWRTTRGLLCALAGACAAMLLGAPADSDIHVSVEVVRSCAISTVALPPAEWPALTVSCLTESEAIPQVLTTATAPWTGDQEVTPVIAAGGAAGIGTPASPAASGPSLASGLSSPPSGGVVSGDGGAAAILTINF